MEIVNTQLHYINWLLLFNCYSWFLFFLLIVHFFGVILSIFHIPHLQTSLLPFCFFKEIMWNFHENGLSCAFYGEQVNWTHIDWMEF